MSQTKTVPFYANRADDTSCMLAAIRSVLEYFTDRTYSWKEMEDLIGYKPNESAWTVKVWAYLAAHGFDVRMIEGFNYKKYQADGIAYLQTFLKPEELDWQIKHTNLLEIKPLLPTFLQVVRQEVRSPQLTDVDTMLLDGYLVTVQLNSKVLNGQSGYVSHMILVYDKEGDEYIAHDPGLPPRKSRRISSDLLFKAMGGKQNTVEVTGIRATTRE